MLLNRKIDVIPFKAEHYLSMLGRGLTVNIFEPMETARLCERGGPAFTGIYQGQVVMCGGIIIPWPGLGEAWALAGPLAKTIPISIHLVALRVFRSIIENGNFRRVQADVSAEFATGQSWAKALGFEYEGMMQKYGPNGEAFIRFAMFPGGK